MKSKIIKGVLWALSIFLLLLAISALPAFSGFLFLIGGVAVMPIKPIQNLWAKLPVGKWAKAACASLAFLLGVSLAPAAEPAPNIVAEDAPPVAAAMPAESSSAPESSEAVAEPEPESSAPPVPSVASSESEPEPEDPAEPTAPPVSSTASSLPEPEPASAPEPEQSPAPVPEPDPEASSEASVPVSSAPSEAPSKAPESSTSATSRAPAQEDKPFPDLQDAPATRTTPDQAAGETRTAYWTPNGKSYHYTDECSTLARSKTINSGSLTEALNAGKLDPCDQCAGG